MAMQDDGRSGHSHNAMTPGSSSMEWLREIGADVIGWTLQYASAIAEVCMGVVDAALLTALVRDGGRAVSVRKTQPISYLRPHHWHVTVIQQMSNTAALQQLAASVQDSGLAIRIVTRVAVCDAVQAHRVTEAGACGVVSC